MASGLRNKAAATPPSAAALQAQVTAAERFARECLGTIRHEIRVAEIASHIFSVTARLHRLDRRRVGHLLRLASVLHDVGRSIDDAEHPAEGAALILRDKTLPLAPAERRALAYLTLYHRGEVPPAGEDDVLHPGDDHRELLDLLALLRSADALDSRSLGSPRLAFALRRGGRRTELQVTCCVGSDSHKAKKMYRRKKFRLLEERFGCRVVILERSADDLRLVA
jgi:exopolyphosphatase/pppGpp-phosphohydrolase